MTEMQMRRAEKDKTAGAVPTYLLYKSVAPLTTSLTCRIKGVDALLIASIRTQSQNQNATYHNAISQSDRPPLSTAEIVAKKPPGQIASDSHG